VRRQPHQPLQGRIGDAIEDPKSLDRVEPLLLSVLGLDQPLALPFASGT
jgi:hypothetical protein